MWDEDFYILILFFHICGFSKATSRSEHTALHAGRRTLHCSYPPVNTFIANQVREKESFEGALFWNAKITVKNSRVKDLQFQVFQSLNEGKVLCFVVELIVRSYQRNATNLGKRCIHRIVHG